MWVACLLDFVHSSALFLECSICLLEAVASYLTFKSLWLKWICVNRQNMCHVYDFPLCICISSAVIQHQPSQSQPPKLSDFKFYNFLLFSCFCFCRNVQPGRQRCSWYPSSTDADDCSASNSSTSCGLYRWAHPTEPVESAAAGAASAHAQTGTEKERTACPQGWFIFTFLKIIISLLLKSNAFSGSSLKCLSGQPDK